MRNQTSNKAEFGIIPLPPLPTAPLCAEILSAYLTAPRMHAQPLWQLHISWGRTGARSIG